MSKTEIRVIFHNEELEPMYINPDTFANDEGKLTLARVLEVFFDKFKGDVLFSSNHLVLLLFRSS